MQGNSRVLIASLLLAGLITGTVALPGNGPTTYAGDDTGGRNVFVIFSINNVGFIDVCGCKKKKVRQGSVARRASLFHQLRGKGKPILAIDGGNSLFNEADRKVKPHERAQLVEKSKVLVESYNRMGYSALTVGHGEFAMGWEALAELRKQAKFPFLSANIVSERDGGKLVFQPTHEVEVNGVKVGLLGLSLVSIPPQFMDKDAPGMELRLRDAIEAAKKYVPELRARNDLVIVMSQNSADYNQKLLNEVPGIDFLIDPFIKVGTYTKWIRDDNELIVQVNDAFITRTDAQGARVGSMDVTVYPKGSPLANRADSKEVPAGRSSFRYERISIEPHLLEDPEIQLLVDKFREGTKFVNTDGLPAMVHKDKYLTAETCKECHEEQYKWWQGTKHAQAFASLETTNDQWRQDCIGCHVLGYGQAFLAPADAEPYKDVQCESCHGLNPTHPEDPENKPWGRITEKDCLVCHNKDQTRNDFNFIKTRRQIACPKIQR